MNTSVSCVLASALLVTLGACGALDVSVGANVPKGQVPAAPISALYLEAEQPSTLRGFTIESDSTASNKRCLAAPADASETDEPGPARASYDFELEKSASYVLWGRIHAPGATSNRFWFQLDGGTWYKWRISVGDIWYWDDLHDDTDYSNALKFELEAGAHQLVLADAVSGVELDRLYITADGDTPPGNDTTCNPPHSIEIDGACLPSCGAQRGRVCGASACAGRTHIAAYDCDVCCMGP